MNYNYNNNVNAALTTARYPSGRGDNTDRATAESNRVPTTVSTHPGARVVRGAHLVSLVREREQRVALNAEGDKLLGLPGGKIEQGESVEDALTRELLEELNCDVPRLDLETGWRVSSESIDGAVWQAHYVMTNRTLPGCQYWPVGTIASGVSQGLIQPYVLRVLNDAFDGKLLSVADYRRIVDGRRPRDNSSVSRELDALLTAPLPPTGTQHAAVFGADAGPCPPPSETRAAFHPTRIAADAAAAFDYASFDHQVPPKTALNNAAQEGKLPSPAYRTESTGEAHCPQFSSKVRVGNVLGIGSGRTKTEAESNAAAHALALMGSFNPYGNGQTSKTANVNTTKFDVMKGVPPANDKNKKKSDHIMAGPGSPYQKKLPGPGHALTLLVLLACLGSASADLRFSGMATCTAGQVDSSVYTATGGEYFDGLECSLNFNFAAANAVVLALQTVKAGGSPSTVQNIATPAQDPASTIAVMRAIGAAAASTVSVRISREQTIGPLSAGDQLYVSVRCPNTTPQYAFSCALLDSWGSSSVREVEAARANRLAHSLNGNTSERHSYDPLHENDKQNPFAEFDEAKFDDELRAAVHVLPAASEQFALCVIDNDHDYLAANGFVYEATESVEREAATAKVVAAPKEPVRVNGAPPTRAAKQEAEGPHEGRRRVDMAKRLRAMAVRVVGRLKSWGGVVDWLNGGDPPSFDVVKAVVEEAERQNLPSKEGADYWVASCMAAERTRRATFEGLTNWSKPLATLAAGPTWKKWISRRFPAQGPRVPTKVEVVDSETFRDAVPRAPPAAGPYDDRMTPKTGSFNAYGNQQRASYLDPDMSGVPKTGSFNAYGNEQMADWSFPNAMSEIAAAPSIRPLIEADGAVAGPVMDPIVEVEMLTGLKGQQGVTMSSVPRETALRGGTISTANAVTTLNDLNHPEALLHPLQVRNGAAAALIAATRRPSTFGVGTVRRTALRPSVESAEGVAIREQVARGGNIRADQITLQSFKTSDVAALLRLEPDMDGDTIVTQMTKLLLYSVSRSWLQNSAFLPVGGEPGKFDSFTQLDVNPAVTVGYNNAAVFGLDNGGNVAPTLPFQVTVPTVAFHVCKASIPNNEQWLMVSPGMLLQNDRGNNDSINIALATLSVAPYPIGTHTVVVPTLDDAGGNAANQTFVPFSDLVHMPGANVLHILLPSDAGANPATQAQALALAKVRPTGGPTAWGALAANAALVVNAPGVALVSYSMADYLGSWMALPNSPIDVTTLTRFRKQLSEIFQRSQDLQFSWEFVSCLATRYPAMVEAVVATPTKFAANSAAAVAMQNFVALQPTQMTANAPVDMPSYDWYLPSTNFMWWNKIMSGAYVPTPDTGVQPPPNRPQDGSPRLLQYLLHTVRDYAVTWEVMLTYMMQSQAVWNSAFTQQNYVGVLEQIRDFFTESQRASNDGVIVSESGNALAVLHCRVNGARPAADMYGHTLWEYLNVPRVGFQAALSTAGAELTNCTPCVLPDIWLQTEMKQNIRAVSPMLSSNKLLTGLRIEDGQVTPLGAGSYTTPLTIETQPREVGIDTVPLVNDDMLFNARLVWHTFPASMYTLDGTIFAASLPASSNVVAQKSVVADWTVSHLLTPSVLTAKTTWMPFMTTLGLRLAVGVTAANGAALMTQIMAAKTTTGVASWLIRNARAMPNTIVDGGGRNRMSKIPKRVKPENSTPSSGTASVAGQEATN